MVIAITTVQWVFYHLILTKGIYALSLSVFPEDGQK